MPWSPDARDARGELYLELTMQRQLGAAGRDDGAGQAVVWVRVGDDAYLDDSLQGGP